jgi:alpha-tubulin suppressor-like RCC1 family protein
MENKLMELIPQDVWQLIAQRLSQKDRSSARAVSRFFFKQFTPEWDRYCHNHRKIRVIVVGANHSLLLTETGELFGCGNNGFGQLGLGHTEDQASWIKLSDKIPIRAITAGSYHSLLLTETGELFGCGNNQCGQLGLEPTEDQASWIKLSDKTRIRAIAAGDHYSLLLTETGELFGCGNNQCGQLGLGPTENPASWIKLSDKTRIRMIAAGASHSLLLTETGELLGCGNNGDGQLGLGHTENPASWIALSDNTPVRAIAAGIYHSLMLTEMGELFGCGFNGNDQLGLGASEDQASWIKLNPFPKSLSLGVEEFVRQRHLAFTPVSLKTLLQQCDALFQQLHAEDDKAQQLALFSAMKSSLQAQLTEPLPAPWDQEFQQLSLTEFTAFYQRLRAHCKLAPAEESSSSNILTI